MKHEFEWTGKEEEVNTRWSNGKRRWFKIPDGRVFCASGICMAYTGFEVAIFDESGPDGETLADPERADWTQVIQNFLDELYEEEAKA